MTNMHFCSITRSPEMSISDHPVCLTTRLQHHAKADPRFKGKLSRAGNDSPS